MNTLTVWRFTSSEALEDALAQLERLAAEGAVTIDDAAVVSWPPGRRKPSTRTLGSVTGPGSLWGGFWGMLLALIFLVPIAGPTFGAGAGAVAAGLSEFGIEDDFLKRVRDLVTPGTSAIFLISDPPAAERLSAALGALSAGGLRSTLSVEQERRLSEALGEEGAHPVA